MGFVPFTFVDLIDIILVAVIMYWSVDFALIEIGVCFVIFGVLWKKMNEKYGE